MSLQQLQPHAVVFLFLAEGARALGSLGFLGSFTMSRMEKPYVFFHPDASLLKRSDKDIKNNEQIFVNVRPSERTVTASGVSYLAGFKTKNL